MGWTEPPCFTVDIQSICLSWLTYRSSLFHGSHTTLPVFTGDGQNTPKKSHKCNEVLEPTYTPGSEPQQQELFEAKQTFVFSVFNANLQTDMGKTIEDTWTPLMLNHSGELSEHMRTSSKETQRKEDSPNISPILF